MAERGIDISGEFPKPWTDEIVRAADVVITMGCGDACPIFPGKRYEEWDLDDPAGLDVDGRAPDPRRDRTPGPRPAGRAQRRPAGAGRSPREPTPWPGGWSPSSSAPACWSPSSSAPASPPSGSPPTTSGCSCWRTRPPPFLGLTVLILMFGPVSGAHFNPVVSAADWLLGRRAGTGLTGREVLAYSAAQVIGAIAGAVLANVMFEVPLTRARHHRPHRDEPVAG